jgi:hypothetical protein
MVHSYLLYLPFLYWTLQQLIFFFWWSSYWSESVFFLTVNWEEGGTRYFVVWVVTVVMKWLLGKEVCFPGTLSRISWQLGRGIMLPWHPVKDDRTVREGEFCFLSLTPCQGGPRPLKTGILLPWHHVKHDRTVQGVEFCFHDTLSRISGQLSWRESSGPDSLWTWQESKGRESTSLAKCEHDTRVRVGSLQWAPFDRRERFD